MSRTSSTFKKNFNTRAAGLSSSFSGQETLRKSSSGTTNNTLRKSTGNLAAHLSGTMSGKTTFKGTTSSTDLERIESEYIKNLQQQVYFLELEANYLREQARKATDIHPHMTAEAERMLTKLRQMQAEVDSMHMEVKRKDASLELANSEKERALLRLKNEEDSHGREKRLLLDEVVQAKKEKDLISRESQRKDQQIQDARDELDKTVTALRSMETRNQLLRNQTEQLQAQVKLSQTSLEEKRTELLKTETMLREVEDKYYSSTASLQDKIVTDLREEIRELRHKLKETEMGAEQDRYLRTKISDDSSHLVKQNALLQQQVSELQKQLDRERGLRESNDSRHSANISEMVMAKDKEKSLQFELQQTKEQLASAHDRLKHYLDQLSHKEHEASTAQLKQSTASSRVAELQLQQQNTDAENQQLRRDKVLLVDHVTDLQKQVENKEKEMMKLRTESHGLEAKLKELGQRKALESSLHTQKLDEFSRLADSMSTLSRSLATSSSPNTLRTSRNAALLDYS